jgi:signal transduction histidine kinase
MYNKVNINSIEELAYTLAHEVKNPLSLVKANIDLLELADKDHVYKKNYNVIKNELNKINEMMMDFLQIAKNEKKEYDAVFLFDVAEAVLESYEISLDNDIEFTLDCEDEDIQVLASKKKITHVILNLVKNAVEALPKSGGKIKIEIVSKDKNAFLSVIDNGNGIANEDYDNIAKNFFTTKGSGNGLGIPICKKILDDYEGHLLFKNNTTEGCTFTISLPLYMPS